MGLTDQSIDAHNRRVYMLSTYTDDGGKLASRVLQFDSRTGELQHLSEPSYEPTLELGIPAFLHTPSSPCDIPWPEQSETPDAFDWTGVIVVGVLAGTALAVLLPCSVVLGLAYFAWRRRQKRRFGSASSSFMLEQSEQNEQAMGSVVGSMRHLPSLPSDSRLQDHSHMQQHAYEHEQELRDSSSDHEHASSTDEDDIEYGDEGTNFAFAAKAPNTGERLGERYLVNEQFDDDDDDDDRYNHERGHSRKNQPHYAHRIDDEHVDEEDDSYASSDDSY